MKVDGHKCEEYMVAKFRQPYPVVIDQVTVDNKKVDFVISTGACRYKIDGVMYSGETLICMNKE
jgi:hypothetical protein